MQEEKHNREAEGYLWVDAGFDILKFQRSGFLPEMYFNQSGKVCETGHENENYSVKHRINDVTSTYKYLY